MNLDSLKTSASVDTNALSRRHFFPSVVSLVGVSLVSTPSRATEVDEQDVAILPSDEVVPLSSAKPTTIEYDDFLSALFLGDAEKVQFYGKEGETAVMTMKKGGARLTVLGVASPSSNSPKGPLSTVAKVRDAKVPFSFESFDLTSFRKVISGL